MTHIRRQPRGRLLLLGLLLGLAAPAMRAQDRTFPLAGQDVVLEDVSEQTAVHFRSMRLNRALNVWNVEVTVTNSTEPTLNGPLVLLIESFSNTTGLLNADGVADGKSFLDLSGLTPNGLLVVANGTQSRTLSLGVSGSSAPTLTTRVFARRPVDFALALTRSLDDAGHPLPLVALSLAGPSGAAEQVTDPDSGVVSLGQGAGEHVMRFTADGYLPVWRKQVLTTHATAVVPNPRLTKRSATSFAVSPLNATVVSNASGSIQIELPEGAVAQPAIVTLTPLTGQNLPAFLPRGWSPMQAFWLEGSSPLQGAATARLVPIGPIASAETAALVRWDVSTLEWIVTQTVAGNGTNAINASLLSAGAYALVVGDTGDLAPPAAAIGGALMASTTPLPSLAQLTATGTVTPPSSPASRLPEMVTGTANVVLRHSSTRLPSGFLLRGEVTETYLLSDGSIRLTPQYEHFIVGYQRPGDADPFTLHASFPMRPLLLFGPDELEEAAVRVDVLPEQLFDGQAWDTRGGQISAGGVRILAGSGQLTAPSALRLRRLDTTAFQALMSEGHAVAAAFELTVDSSTLDGSLSTQLSGAPTNGLFILARVLSGTGYFGLQPIERLSSNAQGVLASLEPESGERLPGLRGSGQFVLVQVNEPHGLISGIARNGAGDVQSGMPVQVGGLPWLALTDAQGKYQLVSPLGERTLAARDPATGDTGFIAINLINPQVPLTQDLATAPSGPRVAKLTPADGASRVPRVVSVIVEFNEAVNPATVLGAIQLLRPDESIVPAALTLNLANRIATLSPLTELEPATVYRVVLAGTIADPGGLLLEGQSEFSFTTVPLSARDPAAQLIIYEPGATNVPPEVLAQIPAYTPGQDPFAIVVRGTPGVADPEVAVILVNESTGETATVLSRPDGSFASVISGTEEDFVSATFVNLNGTRVYVPVSRQEFDNGFVGLYRQGGILEAESDGGPVQVIIEPGAISDRSLFKIDFVSAAAVLGRIGNTEPEGGQLLGGIEFSTGGNAPGTSPDIIFPIDPSTLNLEPGETPEERTFALCRAIEVEGVTVFEILDKMEYEDGKLVTRSPPFPGPPHLQFLAIPLMMNFGLQAVITGTVVGVPEGVSPTEQEIINGITGGGIPVRRIPGAVVTAGPGAISSGLMRRGAYVCKANSLGFYSFIYPMNPVDLEPVLLRGQDIRLPGVYGFRALPSPGLFAGPFAAHSANIVIRYPEGSSTDRTPPVLTAFPPAAVLPVGTNVIVDFLLRDDRSDPLLRRVTFNETNSINLITGEPVEDSEVSITPGTPVVLGPGQISVPVTFNVAVSAAITVMADIADTSGNERTVQLRFRFGIAPPPGEDNLLAGDPEDEEGPRVVFVSPPRDSVLREPFVLFRFNEPVGRAITNMTVSASVFPQVDLAGELSPDQQEFVVRLNGLKPGTNYTLTLNPAGVKDLSGNFMPGPHITTFQVAEATTELLGGIDNAVGSVVLGSFAFTLNRLMPDGELVAHQLGDVTKSAPVGRLRLPFFPRAMALVPAYNFKLDYDGPIHTNVPLVAVAGGVVGHDTIGQIMWVIDVSNPAEPRRIASQIIELDPTAAVTGLKWSPPYMVVGMLGSEYSYIEAANLQAFLIGRSTNAVQYFPGLDADGNGDFVGPDDQLPIPERNTFFGIEAVLPLDDKSSLYDFDVEGGMAYMVAIVRRPETSTTELQIVMFNGQPIAGPGSSDGRVVFTDQFARRVALDLTFPVQGPLGVRFIPVAIVGVDRELQIYDLTNPVQPTLLNTVVLGPDAGTVFTITRSDEEEYLIGTGNGIFALNRRLMSLLLSPGTAMSAAVVEIYDGSVAGRSVGASDLEIATSGTGAPRMINRAPRLRVVQFPARPVTDVAGLFDQGEATVRDYLANQVELPFLRTLLLNPCDPNDDNPLGDPPNAALHHYALVRASGMSGEVIDVALESLNASGLLNTPPGKDYGPVILTDHGAALDLLQAQPQVTALRARRLSDNPLSDLFNTYLTDPFVLVRQPFKTNVIELIKGSFNRQFLWSGDNIRVSLDAPPNGLPPLEVWRSEVANAVFTPNVHRTYRSLRAEYIDNPNPSFPLAAPRLHGVDMQSGEFRHVETDIHLEGRELDLGLTRVYESRGRFSGPFGRGWDFNLNARLLELQEAILPPGLEIPLGVDPTGCLEAVPGDVILYDGAGGVHFFRRISEENENQGEQPAYANDPAITEFLGANGGNLIGTFYESPNGLFTILFKFKDGTFMTVGPTGLRMHFDANGRILKLRGTSQKAQLTFVYREDGKLDFVEGDRELKLEFGYFMRFPSSDFRPADRASSKGWELGKVARLRFQPSLANAQEVEYEYDSQGNLREVKPKFGPKTIVNYDAADPNLVVGVGFGDGTELPGQTIGYQEGMVSSVTRDGVTSTFSGAKETTQERLATGNATVSASTGENTYSVEVDNRGRPTGVANRPFAANDQGQPTRVANVLDDVRLIYDEDNEVYRFRGNLIRTEREPFGGGGVFVTETEYDNSAYNRPERLTDVNGVVTEITYSSGEIIERKGPVTRNISINEFGQQTLEQNIEGLNLVRQQRYGIGALGPDGGLEVGARALGMNEHVVSRDNLGRVRTTSGGGASQTIQYNSEGLPETISGSGIPSVTMFYQDGMKTREIIQAGTGSMQNDYTYDPKHKTAIKTFITLETGLSASSTAYSYDGQGRLTQKVTDSETTEFTYDGILVTGMRGPGVSRESTYAAGRLTSLTEQGVQMTFDYDDTGRLESQEVAGLATTFTYDDGDNLRERLKSKKIEGAVAGTILDETYTYDSAGRVRTVSSIGQTRTISYFADDAIRRIEVNGFLAKDVERDQAGRITRSRVAEVEYTFSGHDADFGLPAQETVTLLPSSRSVTRQNGYDTRGRLNRITLPAGTLEFSFDGFGNRTLARDADGVTRTSTYSPGGLPLSVTFADGNSVTYSYTPQRRVHVISGPAGSLTHSYDTEGMVGQLTYPDGAVSRFENRNDFFEPDSITHGDVSQTLTWNEGRLETIAVVATGDELIYERDELGRLVSAELNGVGVELSYNEQGLPISEDSDVGTWSVTYDVLQRLQSESYPSGLTITFGPDSFGLPTTATQAGINTVTWLGTGLPEELRYADGLTVTRHYDTSLRLDRITYTPAANVSAPVSGFEYQLSPGGRVLSEKRLRDGTFDAFLRSDPAAGMRITNFLSQATNSTGAGAALRFTNVNFLHGELTAPAQGTPAEPRSFFPPMTFTGQRVATVDGITVQHDSFGSVTHVPLWVRLPGQTALTRVSAELDYDGMGMVRRVTRADGVEVVYVRDGLGRIVERIVTGSSDLCHPGHWRYVWKGNLLIEEYEETSTDFGLVRRYVYLGNVLAMVQLAQTPGGALENRVPLLSLNGSVRGYLQPDGHPVEFIEYSAYGTPVFLDSAGDAVRPSAETGSTLLFHGAFFDEATGLYQMGQRNLHPIIGRFLQRDSVIFSQSLALFTAFDGDPAGRVDPFGTDSASVANFFGGLDIIKTKKKATDLGKAYQTLDKAVIEFKHLNVQSAASVGSAGLNLVSKMADLATLSPDANIRKGASEFKGYANAMKNGLDVLGAASKIVSERKALATATAASLTTIGGHWKIKGLAADGATIEPGLLGALDRRYGRGPLGELETVPEFDARTAYNDLKRKRSAYADKREENLLKIGKGVNAVAKFGFNKAFEGDDSHAVRVSKQIFEVNDKIFDVAEKFRSARKADDLAMMFLTRKHGIVDTLTSKAGRGALSASFALGFEAGKLGRMFLSDPASAKAYEEQVKMFDENGGWLTVAGGVLSTLGADDAAFMIQQYSDFKATDLIKPILDEREKNLRRTEYYLNGLSAP